MIFCEIHNCYAMENGGQQENVRPQACYQITQIGKDELSSSEYCGCVYISLSVLGNFPRHWNAMVYARELLKCFLA